MTQLDAVEQQPDRETYLLVVEMVDFSNPLITTIVKERKVYEPTLQTDWLAGSETVNISDGEIQERSFIEIEHLPELNLQVLAGGPVGYPDPINFHYILTRRFYEHGYNSQAVFANDGPTAEYNDFIGWIYNVSLYQRKEYWPDTHHATFVWQLRSRHIENEPAIDKLVLFNAAGTVVSSLDIPEGLVQTFNLGRAWGVRVAASEDPILEMRSSGGATINNFNKHAFYGIPSPLADGMLSLPAPVAPALAGIETISPHLMTHPFVRVTTSITERPYFTTTVVDPETLIGSEVPIVKVLSQINVFTFGSYWLQDIDLVNSYDQGVLVHPPATPNEIRLKPPGKSYLSDDFPMPHTFINNAEWR